MSNLGPILVKTYDPADHPSLSEINRSEVMRYGGMMTSRSPVPLAVSEDDDMAAVDALIDECISEALPLITYKVCYRYTDVTWDGDQPVLPFDTYGSKNLAHVMRDCTEAVMFAATIGVGIDRLIAKYNRISPSKALIMQALGAERVEALCDLFNAEVAAEAGGVAPVAGTADSAGADASGTMSLRPRFSPGYGDLPLAVQREFMALLDCAHLIGINLNESLLMSPSKSVTAIIGIYPSH
ncbi:Vitamin B12 dependent methionine synthase, activation domain [Lachnospiraceae bacterium XBB2008]|nr:Vitamin B12 dependent methionine synthase, activation domain [Lachnospiraceae bacterium XBB2008]